MALKFLEKGLLDRLIVCEDDNWGAVGNPHTPIPDHPAIVTFRKFTEGATKPAQWPDVAVDDVALLQYTGGTTGLPKGAMLTHGNLTAAVSIYDVWGKPARAERNDAVERVICVLPLFHIFALTVILLRSLERGDLISLHQRFDVEAVMRDIEVKRATAFPGVPTMWIAIASLPDLDKRDMSSLAYCGSGGAPLPVEVARDLRAQDQHEAEERLGHDRDLLARHRPSAGGTGKARLDRADAARHRDGCGRARRFRKGAAAGRSRRDPHPGARTSPRATGTGRRKPRTPLSATASSPATSATWTQDGYFYLVDRKKDMIISGGFNVYPQMIEQAMYEHPAVHEVIVIGIPDDYRGEAAKAFVKLRAGRQAVHARRIEGVPRRQARQARDSGGAGIRRRIAAHLGRQTLAPRIAQPAAGRAEAGRNSHREAVCDWRRDNSIVVPANARDPYARGLACGTVADAFAHTLTPVVMGPCFRRDDGR